MALWRIRATVDDRPGYLSVLTASLALRSVNILAVQVHTTEAGAVDDFLVDTPDTMTEAELLAADHPRPRPGRVRGPRRGPGPGRPADPGARPGRPAGARPGRARRGAGRPARRGRGHAGGPSRTVRRGPASTRDRMTLIDPAGGTYEVLRAGARLHPGRVRPRPGPGRGRRRGPAPQRRAGHPAAARRRRAADPRRPPPTTSTRSGGCTHAARRQPGSSRYLGGAQAPAEARLRRLLEPAGGLTLLAVHHDPAGGDEQVVAMANLLAEGDLGEVALLVQDDWQRRGIGTALLRRLIAYAASSGFAPWWRTPAPTTWRCCARCAGSAAAGRARPGRLHGHRHAAGDRPPAGRRRDSRHLRVTGRAATAGPREVRRRRWAPAATRYLDQLGGRGEQVHQQAVVPGAVASRSYCRITPTA